MQAELERVEVESVVRRDHDLAVEHAPLGKASFEWLLEIRKVTVERLEVATLDVELVLVLEDERAEAIPLRLVEELVARGDRGRELRQHRLDGRIDGERELHAPSILQN